MLINEPDTKVPSKLDPPPPPAANEADVNTPPPTEIAPNEPVEVIDPLMIEVLPDRSDFCTNEAVPSDLFINEPLTNDPSN